MFLKVCKIGELPGSLQRQASNQARQKDTKDAEWVLEAVGGVSADGGEQEPRTSPVAAEHAL